MCTIILSSLQPVLWSKTEKMGCATTLCQRLTHRAERYANAHFIACIYHPQFHRGSDFEFTPTQTPAGCNGNSGRCNSSEQCVRFQSGGDRSTLTEVRMIGEQNTEGFYCGKYS